MFVCFHINKPIFTQNLIEVLKSELSGDYEDVVVHLVQPAAEHEAWLMHEAISVRKLPAFIPLIIDKQFVCLFVFLLFHVICLYFLIRTF